MILAGRASWRGLQREAWQVGDDQIPSCCRQTPARSIAHPAVEGREGRREGEREGGKEGGGEGGREGGEGWRKERREGEGGREAKGGKGGGRREGGGMRKERRGQGDRTTCNSGPLNIVHVHANPQDLLSQPNSVQIRGLFLYNYTGIN